MKIDEPQLYNEIIDSKHLKKKIYKLKRCLLKNLKPDKVIVYPSSNEYLPLFFEVRIIIKTMCHCYAVMPEGLNNITFPYNILSKIKKDIMNN